MTEDYFKLSEEINKLITNGNELIGELQIKEEQKETLKNRDEVLGDYLTDLSRTAEKIEIKLVKALGQMYWGVIIPNEFSIRKDGKIYPYKCRSEVDEKLFLRALSKRKEEWKNNLKQKDRELFIEILDKIVINEKSLNQTIYNLEIDTSIAKGNIQIPKTQIFDIESNYSDKVLREGKARVVTTMTFDKGRIDFIDEEGENVRNSIINKLLVQKFENEIAKVRESVMNTLNDKKNFLEVIDREVNDKLGKWIMASELSSDKIDNVGWGR